MRIVALIPGGISEQILAFPTLDTLQQAYPNADIDVVVEPSSISAYRVCKSVNDTIAFTFSANNSPADWANLLGILRDRTYTIALYFGQKGSIDFLLWLTGIPRRISYVGSSGSFLLSQAIPINSSQYTACKYHDLLTGLNIQKPCPDLAIAIPNRDLEWSEREQKRLGVGSGGYVLFYNGTSESNVYPLESWVAIAQDFQKRQPDLPLVAVQEGSDATWTTALTQACPAVKVTTPDDIGKLAAMIAAANLMLCTDSIAMHLAVALKVYTLVLLGANGAVQTLPQTNGSTPAAETRFMGVQSPTNKLADLSPQMVLEKVWG